MGLFRLFSRKQPVENKDKLPSTESITLYAEDDNMIRAEKIVRVLGYRGATAGFEKEVWRVLELYSKLDAEAKYKENP